MGILIIAMLLGIAALASVPLECTDLAKVACRPGDRSDGTGTRYSRSAVTQRSMKAELAMRAKLPGLVSDFMKEPGSLFLRNIAAEQFGIDSEDCDSSDKTVSQKCQSIVNEGMVELVANSLFENAGPAKSRPVGLMGVDSIIGHKKYTEFAKGLYLEWMKQSSDQERTGPIVDRVFEDILKDYPAFIDSLPLDEQMKKKMKAKIASIDTEIKPSCSDIGGFNYNVDPNAFYFPTTQEVHFCPGTLMNTDSEFTIATALGHELGHALDGCFIAMDGGVYSYPANDPLQLTYPIPNVVSCLRGATSLDIQSRAAWTEAQGVGGGAQGPGAPRSYKYNSGSGKYGSKAPKSAAFDLTNCVQNDQIAEGVSDWIGAELAARYIKRRAEQLKLTEQNRRDGWANANAHLCDWKIPSTTYDTHSSGEKRINAILMMNPSIRTQMSCPPDSKPENYAYCDPNAPVLRGGYGTFDSPSGGNIGVPMNLEVIIDDESEATTESGPVIKRGKREDK